MKIVCDCGEQIEFIVKDLNSPININIEEDGCYANLTGKIDIHAEHDQVWFNCNNCNCKLWIFT